jgi:transcriptional antiterminator RfaH
MARMTELLWFVAHTRPRCEKKLVQYCSREKLETTLPCFRAVHKYLGKTVAFDKPLFPGYVFLRLAHEQRQRAYQSDYVANLLEVHDQELFFQQLGNILCALETGLEIRLAPEIGVGKRVRIVRGPLRSMEGWVEQRYGMSTVLLRLDFISQAAAVKVEADDLELA